nr:NRDE family protein [Hoyosella altamirensis]
MAWQDNPDVPLIVAANRDEFFRRPTTGVHWWGTEPDVLAGRDELSGGTWMGVTAGKRFAAVTNFRDGAPAAGTLSRGDLPKDFLLGDLSAREYCDAATARGGEFGGFSLFVSDGSELWWTSNRGDTGPSMVQPGIHGLSNALLDTPWPKVVDGKAAFAEVAATDDGSADPEDYLAVLTDTTKAPSGSLPDTGVPRLFEKLLSSRFIRMGSYGTRASTVLRIRADGSLDLTERQFSWSGATSTTTHRIASST